MKNKTYILGIDPGNKGACALLSLDGSEIGWFKIPTKVEVEGTERRIIDAKLLKEHLENFDILTCYIEKQAYKNAKLNANYGICLAVLMILGIDYLPIQSASWMCSLKATEGLEDVRQGTSKDFTFYAFEKIFPDVVLPRKGKLLDDDIADACLLAWLCYRKIDLASD